MVIKDKIAEFVCGSAQIRIDVNDYSADMVAGMTKGGTLLLYDMLNMQTISIKERKDASISNAKAKPTEVLHLITIYNSQIPLSRTVYAKPAKANAAQT